MYGIISSAKTKPRKTENNVIINDSPMNLLIKDLRLAPITFLNPTSFDFFVDLEIERLIKFIDAIIKIAMAITISIFIISFLLKSL